MDAQRKVLGKGLSALLPQRHAPAQTAPKVEVANNSQTSPVEPENSIARLLPLTKIHPNPQQPRQDFDDTRIFELAQSIRSNGVIQPITVCGNSNDTFTIVAGERRWRAAKLAGLEEVPAYIRSVEPDRILELALIENIQREDLNPIETAQAFDQLTGLHHLTHEQIAERTGKDRSTITNFVRLLRLTPEVRQRLVSKQISMGHARALLSLEDHDAQVAACKEIVDKDLSVREAEKLVKKLLSAPAAETPVKPEKKIDVNTRAALDEMAMALGTKVRIIPRSAHSGRLEIEYYSSEDLERIYEAIVPGR
jgi:ParB family transcriptional regulator, chromosome partitioning protein